MVHESPEALSEPGAAPDGGVAASAHGSERARILREGIWNGSGQAVTAVVKVIGTRVLTSLVSPRVYGEVTLLLGVATLGSNLFCAPVLHAALRFYPAAEREGRVAPLRRLLERLLRQAMIVVIALLVLGGAVFGAASDTTLPFACFLVLGALFALDTVRMFETNLLNAARQQAVFSSWTAADAFAKLLFASLAALLGSASALYVISGFAVGTGVVWLLFRVTAVGRVAEAARAGDPWAERTRTEVLRYAAPILPLALLSWSSNLGDRYILAGFADADAAGVYAAAYGLASQPFLMLSGILGVTLRPVLFEAVARGDRARERRTLVAWFGITVLAASSGVALVCLFAEPLVALFLGREFRGAAPLVGWIATAYGIVSVQQVFEMIIYARQRTQGLLAIQLFSTVAGLLLYLLLIPRLGAMGAAIGTCGSLATSCVASILVSKPWERLRSAPAS